jgi:hypothetical protein
MPCSHATPPQSLEWLQGWAESQKPKVAEQVPEPSSQQPLSQSLGLLHEEQIAPEVLPVLPEVAKPGHSQVPCVVSQSTLAESHWLFFVQ